MLIPFHYTNESAHYEPVGQYINLSGYKREEFLLMLQNEINQNNFTSFSHYLHELRHWADHIGTIWGQDYICEIIRCCWAKLTNSEFEPSEISPYKIEEILKTNDLLIHHQHSIVSKNSEVWKMKFGVSFINQIPFFICNVLDYIGNPVCDYPVTYVSLFESNARYEEIQCNLDISELYLSSDEKKVEVQRIHRKYAELAYDSELIEYSIAAAIPAAIFKIENSIKAYAISSTINTLILNLTPDMLTSLACVDNLGEFDINHSILIRNRDFGYLLYYFCKLYEPLYSVNREFNLEEFLACFNLPKMEEFELSVLEHMESNKSLLSNENIFYENFNRNITNGQEIIRLRGIDSKRISLANFLSDSPIRPHLIFGDEVWEQSTLNDILNKPLETLSQYEWWTLTEYFNR